MSATAPDPPVDLTSTEDDPADRAATSKGHRGLDDIWDHYKKIKLEKGEASRLHRNYDDFNHPALDVSATTAPVSAGVLARAQLGDSNEDFDLNDMISGA